MDLPSCGRVDDGPAASSSSIRPHNSPCQRCGGPRSYAVTRQRSLCKECYVAASLESFKKALQPMRSREKGKRTSVLVGYSGGPASSALLMFFELLFRGDARSFVWDVRVVWVDCSDVLPRAPGESEEDPKELVARIGTVCEGFSLDVVPLHRFFSSYDEVRARDMTRRIFKSDSASSDVTWKEELLDHMVRSLLIRRAKELGIHRVATGETMTRACVKLVSGISRGVGSTAAAQVLEVDASSFVEDNIIWAKPLVSMTAKEVALAFRAAKGRSVAGIPSFAHSILGARGVAGAAASTRGLSEAFLNRLEAGHSQSLHVLSGTAAKLDVPDWRAPEWANCLGTAKDPPVMVGSQKPSLRCDMCGLVRESVAKCDASSCGTGGGGCCDTGPRTFLCHACAKVVDNLEAGVGIRYVDFAKARSSGDSMRARIADCLLSDSDENL